MTFFKFHLFLSVLRSLTWACLHPGPPQWHSCHLRSPSVSASASPPAAAPLWTLSDLFQPVRGFSRRRNRLAEPSVCKRSLTWLFQQPAQLPLYPRLLLLQLLGPGSDGGGFVWKHLSFLILFILFAVFCNVLTYRYTSSDSFLTYICFFRIRLNQSTISGSIRMSPSPSKRQEFLTTSVLVTKCDESYAEQMILNGNHW